MTYYMFFPGKELFNNNYVYQKNSTLSIGHACSINNMNTRRLDMIIKKNDKF